MPTNIESMRALCLDESGNPKQKNDCRALLINHLILEEMMDVDEAEDRTDAVMRDLGLWREEEAVADDDSAPAESPDLSTDEN